MQCSLDWVCRHVALARVHPVGGLGDPWTWGCVVVRRGDTAVVLLAQAAPTPSEARAFLRALEESGMTRRQYERRGPGGQARTVRAGRDGREAGGRLKGLAGWFWRWLGG